jgi:hypothetical protein
LRAVCSCFGIRFISSLRLTSMLQRYRWKAKFEGKLKAVAILVQNLQ